VALFLSEEPADSMGVGSGWVRGWRLIRLAVRLSSVRVGVFAGFLGGE
jgi:hypothetical protein